MCLTHCWWSFISSYNTENFCNYQRLQIKICFSLHFYRQIGCLVAMSIEVVFHDSLATLYIASAIFGVSLSSVYPTSIALAEHNINMNGKCSLIKKFVSFSLFFSLLNSLKKVIYYNATYSSKNECCIGRDGRKGRGRGVRHWEMISINKNLEKTCLRNLTWVTTLNKKP